MEMQTLSTLDKLMRALPSVKNHHAPTDSLYEFMKDVSIREARSTFKDSSDKVASELHPFGKIYFPYHKMGAIDTLDLFGIDELIIFSFYWANRNRYRKVLDLGANLGLHSIILSKCGYDVESYEPDPRHFEILKRNLELNKASHVRAIQAAVSVQEGTAEFVRVLGNTTGSHLAGAKSNPYGDLERFSVKLVRFADFFDRVDFIKMDVEGHEKEILLSTTSASWKKVDCMAEVGTPENAAAIFKHMQAIGVPLFAQKINWARVTKLEDMPTSHREGSLFITMKPEMPWG